MRVYVAVIGLLALGALFACLGAWQLARADVSRATLAAFEAGAAEPVRAALPRSLDEERRFERVQVRGEYELEPQFLLDNMLHDGVAGYHVLSALRVHGLRERVLVNRGWVPVGADRRVLPEVAVSPGERTVVGRLERLPRPGIRLGEDSASGAPDPCWCCNIQPRKPWPPGSESPCSTISCCSMRPRRTATCASGAPRCCRRSGISATPCNGGRWAWVPWRQGSCSACEH